MRMSESSVSKRLRARTLASWVFPTPVGPRNRKVPIGFPGSLSPARLRMMALVTLSMASSCPITLSLRVLLMLIRRLLSLWASFWIGMWVVMLRTASMSSLSTVTGLPSILALHFLRAVSSSSSLSLRISRSMEACLKSFSRMALLFSFWSTETAPSRSDRLLGTLRFLIWARLPASSMMSTALSGRQRSDMYLWLSDMQLFSASSV